MSKAQEREIKTVGAINKALEKGQNVYARTEDNAIRLVTGNVVNDGKSVVADTTGGRQKIVSAKVIEQR